MVESFPSESLSPEQALVHAVNRLGGQSAMARLLGVRQSTVWEWLNPPKQLPAEHVLTVEAATHVSRHDLRPDLYPRGLQDGVPFQPDTLNLGEIDGLVADQSDGVLQAPEWPIPGSAEDVLQAGATR